MIKLIGFREPVVNRMSAPAQARAVAEESKEKFIEFLKKERLKVLSLEAKAKKNAIPTSNGLTTEKYIK